MTLCFMRAARCRVHASCVQTQAVRRYHLSLFYTKDEIGVAYSAVTTATALSQVIGGPLAAAILLLDGKAGLWGWQWLFILVGTPTIFFGALVKVCTSSPALTAVSMPAHAAGCQIQGVL